MTTPPYSNYNSQVVSPTNSNYNSQGTPLVYPNYNWQEALNNILQTIPGYNNPLATSDPTPEETPDPNTTPDPTPTPNLSNIISQNPAQVVPGTANPNDPSAINVVDYAGQVAGDPSLHFSDQMQLSNQVPEIDGNAEGTNLQQQNQMDYSGANAQVTEAQTETAAQVDPRQAVGYDSQTTQQNIAQNGQATAAQGTVSEGAQMSEEDIPQIEIDAHAKGETELGKALLDHAEQNLNDVDPKATVKGQLEQLQADFTGPNGEPIIPVWAQGTAREISKIAAFKGMTGSAATAAMSQALMEASLPVATADAQFFQTLTLENLSNKQQSIINRANVLSKFEEMNQDSRTAAAINNAKAFLEMDLANLSNRQQAEVINTQARVQSILEDAKAVNTERMFETQSQNDMNMYYDNLRAQIDQYNTSQSNAMAQFNASEANSIAQFNSGLENQREQFYRDMQYNIDVSNAKWRQTVTLQNNQNQFEAAAVDVRNMVDMSVEQLNQIWDRSDAMLDYVWKSAENELERDNRLALATLQAQTQQELARLNSDLESRRASSAGWGAILGTIAGNFSESLFDSWF